MHAPETDPDRTTLQSLAKGIRKPGVSLFYTLGLGFVASAMVLLPLLYLALVGCVAYGVYWHATEHLSWFASRVGGIRLTLVKGFAYAAILAVGLIMVFFLLKPLFARIPKHAQPLALHPGAEPRLFALIVAICKAVGAPQPRRIDLDANLNASASFRRGVLSFLGGDLVLTLGLPLVANLTVAELAGIVAHEFGHFTQGLAMRLGYVISCVNRWFARVVFERDSWDVWLSELGENPEDWRVGLVVWTAQVGIGLSRFTLRVFMNIGIALSAFLSRQMEFHADTCEIRLAGSEHFEQVTRKFATLSLALHHTQKVLRSGWNQSRQLPDNLPELIRRIHDDLPDATVTQIQDTLGLGRTQWYDTHPCPAERIRSARRQAAPGIFTDDRPATALFENFEVPARQVTELYYRDDLGLDLAPESLLPLAPRNPDAATAPDSSPRASNPSPYTAPPLDSSLLLDAPELLLPLPLMDFPAPDDATASSPAPSDASEWIALVSSLESLRPQLEELAQTARRILTEDTPASAPAEYPSDSEEWKALRHAAREVTQATARRLYLGLQQALPNQSPNERGQIQELWDWLRTAAHDYPVWQGLGRRLPLCIAKLSQAALHGEIPEPLQAEITQLKKLHANLESPKLLVPLPSGGPRKLRIGPLANSLRELESLLAENSARLASYRHALQSLWGVAGAEEQRTHQDHP